VQVAIKHVYILGKRQYLLPSWTTSEATPEGVYGVREAARLCWEKLRAKEGSSPGRRRSWSFEVLRKPSRHCRASVTFNGMGLFIST